MSDITSLTGLQYDAPNKRYVDVAANVAYLVFETPDELLNYARVQGLPHVIKLNGWAALNSVEYAAFMAANNNNGNETPSPTTFLVAVSPSSMMLLDQAIRQNAFQVIFALFALNASYGFGLRNAYATPATSSVLQYAVKTKNPSGAEYDLFVVDGVTEVMHIEPDTSASKSAVESTSDLRDALARVAVLPDLQLLGRELSGLRFGYTRDYGIDNALFHPCFAKYYKGKVTAPLPAGTIVFEGGHLEDWTVNADVVYKAAQMAKIASLDRVVQDAIAGATVTAVVQKTSAELFDAFKGHIKLLVDLHNRSIDATQADVWETARPQIDAAYDALLTEVGTQRVIVPNVAHYTNGEGKLYVDDTEYRLVTYSNLGAYYPEGVKNAAVVLLELIARLSITDATRPAISDTLLRKLASSQTVKTDRARDASVAPFIAYMRETVRTIGDRVKDAIAEYNRRAAEFKRDTGMDLPPPSDDVRALRTQTDETAIQRILDDWDNVMDGEVNAGYDAYRAQMLDAQRKAFDANVSSTQSPLATREEFDALVAACQADPVPTSAAEFLSSASYKAVLNAVASRKSAPPPRLTLDIFTNPSPAVQKAMDALNGSEPSAADIATIEAAGKHTPYSARFVPGGNMGEYDTFMKGYGATKIGSKAVLAVIRNEHATPLELACAEARIYSRDKSAPATTRRKALAFSQIIV